MSGTFAFAISRLRTERPSLRPWHHIGRLRDRKSSLNLTLLLYQIFWYFSNERSLRVSNATTRADGLGRSLVCRQERLTRYIQSYLTKVLGLTKCPLFLASLDPGPGNRSLLGLRLRKFLNPRDNQTSVGLHNYAFIIKIFQSLYIYYIIFFEKSQYDHL